MVNTLYLPEIREMLAASNHEELRELCEAIHPAGTAEFMEGLTADEAWQVLRHTDPARRGAIFHYFDVPKQVEILQSQDRAEMADLVAYLAPDDRVDLLNELDPAVREELLALLPREERRDILRLSAYPEGSAGAVMTTDVAKFKENMTVQQALEALHRQSEDLETVYYLYIVDDAEHLRGLVSARQLISHLARPQTRLGEIMETELVTVDVDDDQEVVADKVARYDLLAIPVVDDQHRMLGIITYDDVIDVVREEATADAHQMAGIAPLETSYLQTSFFTLSWKRGVWLGLLFLGALFTATTLRAYEERLESWPWLVLFIPLVISTGGNSGNQSATLVITALTRGDITPQDWLRIVIREIAMGTVLGAGLALIALSVLLASGAVGSRTFAYHEMLVVPLTLVFVVVTGTLVGSILPLVFRRVGWDPALMSNPFVAGIVDILGIVIYMTVAALLLA